MSPVVGNLPSRELRGRDYNPLADASKDENLIGGTSLAKTSTTPQISLSSSGVLKVETVVSEEEDGTALYKCLLAKLKPILTSRHQLSQFVRDGLVTINDARAGKPNDKLTAGEVVVVAFDWRKVLLDRLERFYEVVEPNPIGELPLATRLLHTCPQEDVAAGFTKSKLLVTWKPPGVSPLHVLKSIYYKELLDNGCSTAEEAVGLYSSYLESNPCEIKGASLLYSVEKSIGGLCVTLVSDDDTLELRLAYSKVICYYHAMCHGQISEEIHKRLEGFRIFVDRPTIRCNESSFSSVAGALSEFNFFTESQFCGKRTRCNFKEAGVPLVGHARYAIPLRNEAGRGLLLALTGVSLYNPLKRQFQYYEYPEPEKFSGVFHREVELGKKKLGKGLAAMEEAGVDEVDELTREELLDGKPVAYITGSKKFCGYGFQVDENTLIPRPSSESLVYAVLELYEKYFEPFGKTKLRILDIGTGSGCILLSCLKAIPSAYGVGIDISVSALEVAKRNASALGLVDRCHFSLGDLSNPRLHLAETSPEGAFDIVVCNPPYLPMHKMNSVQLLSLQHEPRIALFTPMADTPFSKVPTSYLSLSALDQPFLFDPESELPVLVIEVGKAVDGRSLAHLFEPSWQLYGTRKDLFGYDRCA
ncbi:hypothetical protein L0F63_005233 [Massospora cicadina]|nr:hypothetical protein L0F63_005233 [Massospora cicadina]